MLVMFAAVRTCTATDLDVRVLADINLSSLIVSPIAGEYALLADGQPVVDSSKANIYQLLLERDSIVLKTLERTIGKFAQIRFKGKGTGDIIKIKSVIPIGKIRSYDDDLEVTVMGRSLKVINKVRLEDYIAGVVEGESGGVTTLEYYKLQAILCRTYALSNSRRHEVEGFELCDGVHCQYYKGRTTDPVIIAATVATKGMVIVDNSLNLITAAFHSNCGGETCNSEDVWALPMSYLRSVKDTFCLRQPHARWRRYISTEDWMSYLSLKHKYPVEDSLAYNSAVNYGQHERSVFFMDKNMKIPLKTIRTDFQLKSTYFSIEQKSDSVIFRGRGYGHGVGLCQEGAMQMTKLGFSFKQILGFYYKGVTMVDLGSLEFFREE